MLIVHVVGARPNFMKAAPVLAALEVLSDTSQMLVHTGQHYDANMSQIFFQQLGLPRPDVDLEVGSGSHAVQTAEIMRRFETVVMEHKPDLVLVYGDVNSTVAAALVCSKMGVAVAHVEAGLRSSDRSMPEEINRLLTDQMADLLFTPSSDGDENLRREGVAPEKIHCVGNVMIDTLVRLLPEACPPAQRKKDVEPCRQRDHGKAGTEGQRKPQQQIDTENRSRLASDGEPGHCESWLLSSPASQSSHHRERPCRNCAEGEYHELVHRSWRVFRS